MMSLKCNVLSGDIILFELQENKIRTMSKINFTIEYIDIVELLQELVCRGIVMAVDYTNMINKKAGSRKPGQCCIVK